MPMFQQCIDNLNKKHPWKKESKDQNLYIVTRLFLIRLIASETFYRANKVVPDWSDDLKGWVLSTPLAHKLAAERYTEEL